MTKAGGNGFNELGKSYVERIEVVQKAIDFEMEQAKEATAPLREDIGRILEEAKSNGITKKTIKAVVKARKLARQADAARASLDIGEQDTFDNVRLALGDLSELPLGAAALSVFGKPVPVTPEEKATGVVGAWVDEDGTRSSLAVPKAD